ncbi:MAG: hypothetical protein OER82_11650 [Nitrosopumilus sp.]|nr:hypothetical protein [Nitrosopumilus sp.]
MVKLSILFTLFIGIKNRDFVKGGKLLVATGIVIMIFGAVFHLQGQSIVGPESSFMYSNPDWITYGIQIIVIGITLLFAGISISRIKRK